MEPVVRATPTDRFRWRHSERRLEADQAKDVQLGILCVFEVRIRGVKRYQSKKFVWLIDKISLGNRFPIVEDSRAL